MTQVIHVLPEIDGMRKHSADKKKKKQKALPSMRKGNPKISAEIVLAIRRAHEIDRVPSKELEKLFPDLKRSYIYSVINYLIRSNLRVK